jgi:RHS repeat-associated protein
MKKLFPSLALSLLLCFVLTPPCQGTNGGVGNDNPTGVTGEYNGSVTTAGSYDPYTGNAKRFIDDLTVTGSIGAYPLKFTRILNTRAGSGPFGDGGGWSHSYQWGLNIAPPPSPNPSPCQPQIPDATLYYPDGREVNLHLEIDNGVYTFSQLTGIEPMGDRLVKVGGGEYHQGEYDLKLKDGGTVEFRHGPGHGLLPMAIVDPYGQRTKLKRDALNRLEKIEEPGGRYLQIFYKIYPGEPPYYPASVTVIEYVDAYDGPQGRLIDGVHYLYEKQDYEGGYLRKRFYYLMRVIYDAGPPLIEATYTYDPPALLYPNDYRTLCPGNVKTCNDVRYDGAMSKIEYAYVKASSSQSCPVASGQIKEEKNPTTGRTISHVDYPCASQGTRTETRADGATRMFYYGNIYPGELYAYTDFAFPGDARHTTTIAYSFPHTATGPGQPNTYLQIVTDALQHTVTTEKEKNIGAVMAVIHNNGSRIRYTYSDPGNPYYVATKRDENDKVTRYQRYPDNHPNKHMIQRIDYPDGGWEEFTYNNFNQVTTHKRATDALYSAHEAYDHFEYDERGNLQRRWNATPTAQNPPDSSTAYSRFVYYDSGRWTDRVYRAYDQLNHWTEFRYDARGNVTRATHQDGKYTQSVYKPDGTLEWTADENHPEAEGDPTRRTRYLCDEYKRVVTVTNPESETVSTSYDPNHGVGVDLSLDHTTSSVYQTRSHLGKTTNFWYDANWRRTKIVQAPGTSDEAITNFVYDIVGNLQTTEDPRHKFTAYGYDDRNRQTSVTVNNPPETTSVVYDDAGNKKSETRPDGAFRTWDYDAMNRLWHAYDWRISDPPAANQTTTYGYDIAGNIHTIKDTKEAVYEYQYDLMNRKVGEKYPGVIPLRSYGYDNAGNLTDVITTANQHKHLNYDTRNRQDHTWWDGGTSVGQDIVTGYDDASRVTSITTNSGETIIGFKYDHANRKIWEDQTFAGHTRRVQTDLDSDGNRKNLQVTVDPQSGNPDMLSVAAMDDDRSTGQSYFVKYEYTNRNQLKRLFSEIEGWAFISTYDSSGNRTAREATYNNSNVASFTNCPTQDYDALNRPLTWEHTSTAQGGFGLSGYHYDRANREDAVWRAENSNRGERFEYEFTSQLKKVSYGAAGPTPPPPSPTPPGSTPTPPGSTPTPPGSTATPPPPTPTAAPGQVLPIVIEVEGDAGDPMHVTMRTDTPDAIIFYKMSPDSYLLPTHNGANGTNNTATYYQPLTVPVGQVRYFQAVAYKAGMTDSELSRAEVRNIIGGGNEAPNAVSRVVTYAYSPDKLNRTSVTDGGVTTAFSPNPLNQYMSVGGQTFSYDDNFNLTHAGSFNGIYDAANHLISASDTSQSPAVIVEFVYDGLGRCVKRTIGGVATIFAYDGWKPIAEWNAWIQFKAWNVYGTGPDEILLRHEVQYGYLRFHTDRHGNVTFLLDNDGRVVEKYSYDAFGRPAITGAGGDPRGFSHYDHCFLFQGREYIYELGIYDYRNRFYHPALGRFLQGDPIGLQTEGLKLTTGQKEFFSTGGAAPETFSSSETNLFRYSQDDPVNKSDPLGLYWEVQEFEHADNWKIWQMILTAEKLPGPVGDRFREISTSPYRIVIIPIQTKPEDQARWQVGARDKPDDRTNQTTANDPINNSNGRGVGSRVEFDPNNAKDPEGKPRAPIDAFGHEAGGHGYRNIKGINSGDRGTEEEEARRFQVEFHNALKKLNK